MALKDITLGQYFPGQSIVHRLDPRTKLICVVCYIVALFLAQWWVTYGIMFLVLAAAVRLSTISPKAILRGMKPVVFLLVFTAILNALYYPGEHLIASFWIFEITWEGILHAFFMVVRIMLLVSCTFLLTYTTSPPIHELAMMMSIALRFIPLLIEETDKIMSAQRARGADFDSGNLIEKAKALIPLLVPLFVSAFRRADELATAMECRCYHGGEGRTRMRSLRYQSMDWVTMVLFVALCAVIGVLGLRLGL